MSVRCGNHDSRVYHDSAREVRECYATHFSKKRITVDDATGSAEPEIEFPPLPSWMTDEDPDYVRPLPPEGRTMRGWWDLPIAGAMWGADARDMKA